MCGNVQVRNGVGCAGTLGRELSGRRRSRSCHTPLRSGADRRGLLVERAPGHFGIAVEHHLHVLTDMQWIEQLQIWEAFEEVILTYSLSACCISSIDSVLLGVRLNYLF